ncbi:MAG: ribonuclease HII [Bacteroidota bacterium]
MDRLKFEQKLWNEGLSRVMGLDEVGRGCLAGPVVAAGVILNPDESVPELLKDSKQLDEPQRLKMVAWIKSNALFYSIQEGSIADIDRLNILWASIKAMQTCVEEALAEPEYAPQYLLVDGNRFTDSLIPYTCLTKGDDRSASIAAASILAKVYRDDLMRQLHLEYPYFSWDTNVGYPTQAHYQGLSKHGITKYHRRSFNLKTDKLHQA